MRNGGCKGERESEDPQVLNALLFNQDFAFYGLEKEMEKTLTAA